MDAKINKVMSGGYDYDQALARTNRTRDEVKSLKEKVTAFNVVPKSIHEKQVKFKIRKLENL